MGGLAAVIDWDRPVAPDALDPMLALTPHRATGGTRRIALDHAALSESFFSQDAPVHPGVVSVAHLSIVGDLRLWNRDGLRSRAGGISVTAGMEDRRLILEAYLRTGIGFLDDVDGDFAFVIWDDRKRRLLAVRDRFGAKPLFLERGPAGVRFASEVKQLVATSRRSAEPCVRSVSEHLTAHYIGTRFSSFQGVERIRPATALEIDASRHREVCYWAPHPDTLPPGRIDGVGEGFREHLVDSVRRRIAGSQITIAQVTGGHDSSAVTAAAHILFDRDQLTAPFHTVSAVFPGHSNDESAWIDEIVERQPFAHRDFVPRSETVDRAETHMWTSDTPRSAVIEGLWAGSIQAARSVGADLMLTGYGGDEVLDNSSLLADLLRSGDIWRWARGSRSYASWSNRPLARVVGQSVLRALPSPTRTRIRSLRGRTPGPDASLLRPELWDTIGLPSLSANQADSSFPSLTQNLIVAYTTQPRIVHGLEYDEAIYASSGIEVTHPFLDRALVEYVASIPTAGRHVDGRTKTLARDGFASYLPPSVRDRRTVTFADDYLDTVIARLSPILRSRYPAVPDASMPYVDAGRYASALRAMDVGRPTYGDGSIWRAWMLMAWLDQFGRYGVSNNGTTS